MNNIIFVLGPLERTRAQAMLEMRRPNDPPSVDRYLRHLTTNALTAHEITCEVQGDLAIWYCTEAEGFALLGRIHQLAEEDLFRAVTSGERDYLVEASWWLSRAAIADQDIYLAAAGLRRAASPDWDALREGLRLSDEDEWERGLQRAEELLQNLQSVQPVRNAVLRTHFRDQMRRGSMISASDRAAA